MVTKILIFQVHSKLDFFVAFLNENQNFDIAPKTYLYSRSPHFGCIANFSIFEFRAEASKIVCTCNKPFLALKKTCDVSILVNSEVSNRAFNAIDADDTQVVLFFCSQKRAYNEGNSMPTVR